MNNGLLPALIYEMYAASRLRGGILFVSAVLVLQTTL